MATWINVVTEENVDVDYSKSLGYIQSAPRVIAQRTSNGVEWAEAAKAYARENGLKEIGVNCMWCGGVNEIISVDSAQSDAPVQAEHDQPIVRIIADIPAREWLGRQLPERTAVFEQDASGRWSYDGEPLSESEVIDMCKRASNWLQIKREHFPMEGFHP